MPPRRKPAGRPRPASRAIISAKLRDLLASGEHTLFAVARDSGVPLSCLTRFVAGERDLRLATVDQLADVLGLKLVETGRIRVKESRSPRPGSRSPLAEAHRPPTDPAPPGDAGAPPATPADGHARPG